METLCQFEARADLKQFILKGRVILGLPKRIVVTSDNPYST